MARAGREEPVYVRFVSKEFVVKKNMISSTKEKGRGGGSMDHCENRSKHQKRGMGKRGGNKLIRDPASIPKGLFLKEG